MTLNVKRTANETVIELGGRLDSFTAPVLEKMINRSASGNQNVVLELSRLEYISDAGLRVILDSHKKMQTHGSFKLRGVCGEVMETFKTNGCADVLVMI